MTIGTKVPPENRRRTLLASDSLLAEELVARPELPPKGVTTRRSMVITYGGAFEFQVGRSVSWVDPSRLLFAEADQDYVDHHVVPGVGHRIIILTPEPALLDEVSSDAGGAFAARLRGCSLGVQMQAQMLRRTKDALKAHELGLGIIIAGLADERRVAVHDPRCVRKAKELLHGSDDGRLTLTQVATHVGVTPVHLTQAFKRSEGMPLYRYQGQLRLARALALLPGCNDITDLALELGYSSHSHFTAAFRAQTGQTPSAYRSGAVTVPELETPADS